MESLNAKAKAGGQPAAKPAAKPMPVPKAKKAPAYKAAAAKKAMPPMPKQFQSLQATIWNGSLSTAQLIFKSLCLKSKAKVPALPGPFVSSPKGFKAYGAAMRRLNPPKPKPN